MIIVSPFSPFPLSLYLLLQTTLGYLHQQHSTAINQLTTHISFLQLPSKMAVVNASLIAFKPHSFPCPSFSSHLRSISSYARLIPSRRGDMELSLSTTCSVKKSKHSDNVDLVEQSSESETQTETLLYSLSPLPLLLFAALPGATTITSLFSPFVELIQSWSLPGWLVHWGHPGNMAVVLFAMGGYGTYLGFRIRFSDDVEEKAKAKDLHPKLLGGMFFFFALGATGGITSLLTSNKPILESPHAVTGVIGLALLTIQTTLPALFEGNSGLRNVHGILGSGIMTLFLVHAALGLQLGLSY